MWPWRTGGAKWLLTYDSLKTPQEKRLRNKKHAYQKNQSIKWQQWNRADTVLPKMGENNNTRTLSCWSVKTLTLSWLGMMYEIKISRISESVIQRPECEQSSTLGANTVLWHTFWLATECYTLSKALGSSSLSKRGSGFRFDGRGRQELSFKVNGENSLNIVSRNESRGGWKRLKDAKEKCKWESILIMHYWYTQTNCLICSMGCHRKLKQKQNKVQAGVSELYPKCFISV